MARTSQFAKMRRKLKFKVRQRNRCRICGRAARFHPQVRNVPHLFPRPRAQGRNPRRGEGQLVVGASRKGRKGKDE